MDVGASRSGKRGATSRVPSSITPVFDAENEPKRESRNPRSETRTHGAINRCRTGRQHRPALDMTAANTEAAAAATLMAESDTNKKP